MKYFFIVQGEGRGHLMQSVALRNLLVANGHEVCEVLVGVSPHRQIPAFYTEAIGVPVQTFASPNFLPAQKGNKVPLLRSVIYNTKRTPEFWQSIKLIASRIEQQKPDVVINFYDFIAGITFELKRPKTKLVCIAHQYLFLHPHFSFSDLRFHPELPSLLLFTKLTALRATKMLALSFGTHPIYPMSGIRIVPPLIRKDILDATPESGDFILGYMLNTSFREQVFQWHAAHPDVRLEFFWDEKNVDEVTAVDETLHLHKLNDVKFASYMRSCRAYASTSGFESVCEAMYLQKPVLMIPAHIEQRCNAVDASRAGAGIASAEFNLSKLIDFMPYYRENSRFHDWVRKADEIFLKELTEFPTD